jgi:hypothetical protein
VTASDVEPVDWVTFCIELLHRLDRIADEIQRLSDTIATYEEEP